jgi:hypothetical protein
VVAVVGFLGLLRGLMEGLAVVAAPTLITELEVQAIRLLHHRLVVMALLQPLVKVIMEEMLYFLAVTESVVVAVAHLLRGQTGHPLLAEMAGTGQHQQLAVLL